MLADLQLVDVSWMGVNLARVSDVEACEVDASLKHIYELWRRCSNRVWIFGFGMIASLAAIFMSLTLVTAYDSAWYYVIFFAVFVWHLILIYFIDVKNKCDDVRGNLDKAILSAVDNGFTVVESFHNVGATRSPENPDFKPEYIRVRR